MQTPLLATTFALLCASSALHAISADEKLAEVHTDRIKLGLERPWQTDDGVIHFKGQTFDSWRAYFAFQESRGSMDHRCSLPQLEAEEAANTNSLLPPSDCSNSFTNPADEYDPSEGMYRIPCVVHVIRNDNGTLGDIPESRVISGIRILNEDMLALTGTNGENGTDCQIEFYLAEFDPQGNPTNGITFSNNTTWYNDGGNYYNSLAWDPNRYLNIYTTTAGGALGYVPFLPAGGNVGGLSDRVVVLWESFGEDAPIGPPYNLGRTLTHEVGHYLGLNHTFNGGCDSGSCSSSGDLICDTAPQNSATFGCNGSSCSGVAPDDNYMDYSDDQCMEKFTPEQARRMRCTLTHWRPDLANQAPNYITLSTVEPTPEYIQPPSATLRIRITENEENGYRPGTGQLFYSTGGSFQSLTLEEDGDDVYSATVNDLSCNTTLRWYFTADDRDDNTKRLPIGSGTFTTLIADGYENIFIDNGNTDLGYTVTSTGVDGQWTIGDPINCTRGDPADDADGSGRCWLTDNSSANNCNSDVDDGNTVLVSPLLDGTVGDSYLSYYVWYDNSFGNAPGADVFVSEISNDGTSWVTLETIGPSDSRSSGGWNFVTFRISDFIEPSTSMQVRFTAEDAGEGSVIEAAIDGLRIDTVICDDTLCVGDLNFDDIVDGADITFIVGFWGQKGGPADLNGDGTVNGADLTIVLSNWGPCL